MTDPNFIGPPTKPLIDDETLTWIILAMEASNEIKDQIRADSVVDPVLMRIPFGPGPYIDPLLLLTPFGPGPKKR